MQRKGVLPGKIFAPCVPERRFAGLFGCMARISCQSQPFFGCMARESCRELAIFPSETAFGMHGAQNLPRIAARERISRAFCHRQAPGNAPRRNLATARPLGTHRARILPLPVRPRAHQGAILPPSDAGKRISRAFCHRRAPGNASRHNLATTGRPRRTPRATMCYGSRLAHGRGSERPPRLPTPPDIPTPLDCGCCRWFGRWRWHNPLIVALLPSGS